MLPPSLPLNDFESASRAVLAFLHQRLGMGLWVVARVESQDWIVLQSEDHGFGVSDGQVFPWVDTLCWHMVRGEAPHVAPDLSLVPTYRDAAMGAAAQVQAYVGVPLTLPDGSLFGTLCGVDTARQPASLVNELALVELLARLLGSILQFELSRMQEIRRNELLQIEAHTDALTQLANRRAWDEQLLREEERCRRYGHPGAVLVVDLDNLKTINDRDGHEAGDQLLTRTALVLRQAARDADVVARLGGDEFGILAVECDAAGATALTQRTRDLLQQQGIQASIGMGLRAPSTGLAGAWQAADTRMYADKRSRHQPRSADDAAAEA